MASLKMKFYSFFNLAFYSPPKQPWPNDASEFLLAAGQFDPIGQLNLSGNRPPPNAQ
jgi:hypothetical protein